MSKHTAETRCKSSAHFLFSTATCGCFGAIRYIPVLSDRHGHARPQRASTAACGWIHEDKHHTSQCWGRCLMDRIMPLCILHCFFGSGCSPPQKKIQIAKTRCTGGSGYGAAAFTLAAGSEAIGGNLELTVGFAGLSAAPDTAA